MTELVEDNQIQTLQQEINWLKREIAKDKKQKPSRLYKKDYIEVDTDSESSDEEIESDDDDNVYKFTKERNLKLAEFDKEQGPSKKWQRLDNLDIQRWNTSIHPSALAYIWQILNLAQTINIDAFDFVSYMDMFFSIKLREKIHSAVCNSCVSYVRSELKFLANKSNLKDNPALRQELNCKRLTWRRLKINVIPKVCNSVQILSDELITYPSLDIDSGVPVENYFDEVVDIIRVKYRATGEGDVLTLKMKVETLLILHDKLLEDGHDQLYKTIGKNLTLAGLMNGRIRKEKSTATIKNELRTCYYKTEAKQQLQKKLDNTKGSARRDSAVSYTHLRAHET